jgi:hypothetical protein
MKTSFLRVGLPVLVWTLSFASQTFAGPVLSSITVNNPSFETAGAGGLPFLCGTACSFSTDGVIPGWVTTGSTGLFKPGPPTNTSYFNSVPDGVEIAYSDNGTISQTVSPTVQLGVVYTLTVSVGVRNDIRADPGTEALLIGTTPILATGVLPTPGNWSTFTATYTGLAADVGKAITIQLATAGQEGDWDNVALTSNSTASTPEPASGALVGLALLAWAGISRRKRRA